MRYYVDLLMRLWFAPNDVTGYEDMQRGFNQAIVDAMSQVLNRHTALVGQIEKAMR